MSSAAENPAVNGGRVLQDAAEPGVGADQRLLDRGWLRIGAGCLVAGQAMVFSFAMNLSEVEGPAYWVVHGALIAAAVGALVFLGGDLAGSAFRAAREKRMSVDLLFLVTLLGTLCGSLVSTFTRTGAVYYEVVAVLIVVHTAGKMLGARSRAAALRAVAGTRERFEWCDVVRGEKTERVRAGELRAGDRVRVMPGGAISADGVIASGRGFVQETSMTGEWRPVSRGPGERALAGTFSVDGVLEIEADGGGIRKLDTILAAVERARLAPSALQAQADRLVAWFLPVVAGVSAATFAAWFFALGAGWDRALFNAMAVLLVACPCAMGLATPVAIWGGLARLAGFGLVARTGDFLDALARVDFVCFDKTGTLSEEKLRAGEWRFEKGVAGREAWLRACVAALEDGVNHPVAAALRESGVAEGMRVDVRKRHVVAGRGVAGVIDGQHVAVGTREIADGEKNRSELPDRTDLADAKYVFVFVDGGLAATVALDEKWRAGLHETVAALRELGVGAEVLTGDAQGARAGLPMPVRAGLSAMEKAARVEALADEGKCVLFAGDGINDAAAMSVAHASIAMGGGADLARASAMAVHAGGGLEFLPRAIGVARAARRSVRRNLRFAACYNAAGMALAACGVLHPVVAALLMAGSSVIVSVSALRGTCAKSQIPNPK